MVYIKTQNATRDYGGYTFQPVRLDGYWMGFAAVDKKTGSKLLEFAQITKITKKEYEDSKKKPQEQTSYRTMEGNSPTASSLPAPQVNAGYVEASDKKAKDLLKVG
tara:strand:- start:58 stop:375 length:318 start_codon:yes stop_codon:yes gene_type:complete